MPYQTDPVREDRGNLMRQLAAHTGLPLYVVADLQWTDVDTDRRLLELDNTTLPLSEELARLLYWRGCWQRHRYGASRLRWTPQVRVFDDEPVAA